MHAQYKLWSWTLKTDSGLSIMGNVVAQDPRDAVSRACTTEIGNGLLVGEAFQIPVDVISAAPGNFDRAWGYKDEKLSLTVNVVADGGFATIDPATIREIRDCTQRNDHTEGYRLAAVALGLPECAEQFKTIALRMTAEGGLNGDLSFKRRNVYDQMMVRARRMLTPAEYQNLYQSF